VQEDKRNKKVDRIVGLCFIRKINGRYSTNEVDEDNNSLHSTPTNL
jgi:hypothetical protein